MSNFDQIQDQDNPYEAISRIEISMNDSSILISGQKIQLTRKEQLFLKSLARKDGCASKNEIIGDVYSGLGSGISDERLTNLVTRVRKKLGAISNGNYIIAIHGQGYRLQHYIVKD